MTIRTGRHVRLLQTMPDHFGQLHRELSSAEGAKSWRSRGRIPSPAEFEKLLWQDVAFSCVAVSNQADDENALVGLLELFGLDEANGHAQLSVAAFERFRSSGLIVEAVALFLDEVFWRFNLRKIYAMLSESSLANCGSMLDRFFEREGRLAEHVFIAGRFEDVHITSMTRTTFRELAGSANPLASSSVDGWRTVIESDADAITG